MIVEKPPLNSQRRILAIPSCVVGKLESHPRPAWRRFTWTCSRETGQVPRSTFPLDSTSAITALLRHLPFRRTTRRMSSLHTCCKGVHGFGLISGRVTEPSGPTK